MNTQPPERLGVFGQFAPRIKSIFDQILAVVGTASFESVEL
jgi:hypothetical protein